VLSLRFVKNAMSSHSGKAAEKVESFYLLSSKAKGMASGAASSTRGECLFVKIGFQWVLRDPKMKISGTTAVHSSAFLCFA
jgi:hypothetical protein